MKPEDLRRFAELGGWKLREDVDGRVDPTNSMSAITHPKGYCVEAIPDFPDDLAACFEVLEIVTAKQGKACQVGMGYGGRNSHYFCVIYARHENPQCGEGFGASGATKQEAIINAVLKAGKEG